jgi:hypothetical protein
MPQFSRAQSVGCKAEGSRFGGYVSPIRISPARAALLILQIRT